MLLSNNNAVLNRYGRFCRIGVAAFQSPLVSGCCRSSSSSFLTRSSIPNPTTHKNYYAFSTATTTTTIQLRPQRQSQQNLPFTYSKQGQRPFSSDPVRLSSKSTDDALDFLLDRNGRNNEDDEEDDNNSPSVSGYSRPTVQWYPGHIAKAERQLQTVVKVVDVIVEVRDARIPRATSHPLVASWCAGKPRIVVLTHADAVPTSSMFAWRRAYRQFGAEHPQQDSNIDKQIRHEALQAHTERLKYTPKTFSKYGKSLHFNRKHDFNRIKYPMRYYKSYATSRRQNMAQNPEDTDANESYNDSLVVAPVQDVIFVNAKEGKGVFSLQRSILRAGEYVQERRLRKGLQARPLRVGILGFPNVGKSALINRLLGRRRAKTGDSPGFTRSLQWIRVKTDHDVSRKKSEFAKSKEFELLDSPGIIPAVLKDQSDAMLLAACNCIGEAAFDNQSVAAYLCEWMLQIHRLNYQEQTAPLWRNRCLARYFFDPLDPEMVGTSFTGEGMLFKVADTTCHGNPEDAARKILRDFRKGLMGVACLQVSPRLSKDQNPMKRAMEESNVDVEAQEQFRAVLEQTKRDRAARALEAVKERGLELPPSVMLQESKNDDASTIPDASNVGKGQFDGW